MKTKNACIVILALVAATSFADSFSGRLQVLPRWTHSKTVGASTVTETFASLVDWAHTSGTGSNQMNAVVRTTASLTNRQGRIVSLAGGFSDAFGDVTTFTAVRFLCFQAASTNQADIMLGGAASGAWTNIVGSATDRIRVRPGGTLMFLAPIGTGYGVGGGNICVTNTGSTGVGYTIYIGGIE